MTDERFATVVYIDMPLEDITSELAQEALTGRVAQLSPSAVLSLLEQEHIPDLDAREALGAATSNQDLDVTVRASAVRAYLHVAGGDAVPDLADLLGSDQERVAVAAATALGQAGSADQLSALRDLRGRVGEDSTRERVTFAELLIVHRHGLTDEDLALPEVETLDEGPVGLAGRPFLGRRAAPERKRRALHSMKREFPGLKTAQQDVYDLQCGPRLMAVAVDTDAVGKAGDRLAERPAMPSIIALRDPEHGEYSSAFVVLTRAAGRGRVTVQVSRLGGGEVLYAGTGKIGGEAAMVDLRTAKVPGVAPIEGRVRVTPDGVEIFGTSTDRVLTSRNPEKGDPPAGR